MKLDLLHNGENPRATQGWLQSQERAPAQGFHSCLLAEPSERELPGSLPRLICTDLGPRT